MSSSHQEPNPVFNPHAAVAGWLVPGLGHFILGQRRRGVILLFAIGSLWLMGILVGGISVISRYERTDDNSAPLTGSWWYYGQAMIAPSIGVNMFRASLSETNPNDEVGDGSLTYEPSFGRMAEQGTLYTALAGMLNLLAIIDVLYCDPVYRKQRDGKGGSAGGEMVGKTVAAAPVAPAAEGQS